MDIIEYSELVAGTLSPLPMRDQNIHLVLGMVTEAGELADVFKKNLAYRMDVDWINVLEEIGDLLWYIVSFCKVNGLSISDIMDKNIQKLSARYGDSFSKESAIMRNLQKEREVLEST